MSSYRSRGLTAVLCAATAPAHPEELAGERVVVAAFRAAQLTPVPDTRRPSVRNSVLTKGLVVKAAIALAATGSTGVVLAAGTGVLPVPLAGAPAVPQASSRQATPSARPSVTPTGAPSDAGTPAGAGSTPSPSVAGLCRAYEARPGNNPGKALESPAFTALVDAAGGADKVPAYCDSLHDEHPTGRPSDLPAPTERDRGSSPATRPTPPSRPDTPGGGPARTDVPTPTDRKNGS